MPHANVSDRLRGRAKQLRTMMTRAETLLWRYLKAHQVDGLGFRRQVPLQNYIADFACLSAKLIVELDGESHDFAERQRADQDRDQFFAAKGFATLRFTTIRSCRISRVSLRQFAKRLALAFAVHPPSLTLPHKGGGNAQTNDASDSRPLPQAESTIDLPVRLPRP